MANSRWPLAGGLSGPLAVAWRVETRSTARMRISVHHLLRAGISSAALLLAACRSTRDPGCAPDGTGGTGGTGVPGAQAAQPRFYPGQEPAESARPLADAGGWRLGGRGPKFLPIGAEAEKAPESQVESPEPAYAAQPARKNPEFLTWPPVESWPPPGYVAEQPQTTRRTTRIAQQTARTTPKRRTTSAPAPAPARAKPAPKQTEIVKTPPATKPAAAKPAATTRTAKPAPARPQKLTDIPRPGEKTTPEDALEKLRRRAEESLSGN